MRYFIIASIFVLFIVSSALAEAPDVEWTKMYGGTHAAYSYDVEVIPDGTIFVAGYDRREEYPYYNNGLIIKLNLDGTGEQFWSYGDDSTEEVINSIRQTSDGGLIAGGYHSGYGAWETTNYFLMKLDMAGNVSWDNNYDFDTATDYGQGVCQTLDGGYIMVGMSYYYSDMQSQYDWGPGIVKTDAYGNRLNHILLDKYGTQHLHRVIPTSDSGAIAIGVAGSIYIIKIDKNGDTTWVKGCGGVGTGWSILPLADSGYIAFGDRTFSSPYYDDFWMVRLSLAGDTLWTKRYRHEADDNGYGIDRTSDGGFVMAGSAYRNGGVDPNDFYIIRTDIHGDTLWTKMVGRDYGDYATCIKQTPDGGYVVVGWTEMGDGSTKIYVVKLAPDNPSGVNQADNIRPSSFELGTNYPNPFNPKTTIKYTLDRRSQVKIEIFNILGQMVRTLVDEPKSAGAHRVEWDGIDNLGQAAPSGIYLYRFQTDCGTLTRKMSLIK